ncbi:MAG: pitrilysin family protein [Archangium sp.]|nr:pitrilysin family protein [Archangium sp.]
MIVPVAVHRRVCANGLRVIIVEMPNAHTTAISWAVRVGSRDEPPRLAGISHFVEHLKFRGTDRFPTETALHAQFEALGALANGRTSRETTSFWLEVRPGQLAGAVELLGDLACSTTFNGLEVERRIVIEEVAHYQDEDGVVWDLHDLLLLNLFPGQPMGQPVIGTAPSIRAMTLAELKAWVDRHYTAENSVVVIAGPVDADDAVALVERHFAKLARGPVPSRRDAPPVSAGKLLKLPSASGRTAGLFGFAKVATESNDFLALQLLSAVLGPAGFGRLHRTLRVKAGLAYECSADYFSFSDVAMLSISVNVASGKLPQATAEILNHLVELRDRGPTPAELETARLVVTTMAAAEANAPMSRVGQFAEAALDRWALPVEEAERRWMAVTAAEVQRIAKWVLTPGAGHLIARGEPEPGEYEASWARWVKLLG